MATIPSPTRAIPPALILVAGRGERLRPLTDQLPKPLVPDAHGTPLLAKWLARLAQAGATRVVLNPCWLGEAITRFVGDGQRWGVTVTYSHESEPGLETAGGIRTALPLIGCDPFLVVNGDVDLAPTFAIADFVARATARFAADPALLAYLLLVPNPDDHPDGDFTLCPDGALLPYPDPARGTPYTFGGVALYRAALVADLSPGQRAPLAPLLRAAIAAGRVAGEAFFGGWWDIGTAERLAWWRAATAAFSMEQPNQGCVQASLRAGTIGPFPGCQTNQG